MADALLMVFNGTGAVMFFFVLSGCVLEFSLRQSKGMLADKSGAFLVRRLFRIYPALIVTTVLAALFLVFFHAPPADNLVTDWYRAWYTEPLSFPVFIESVLLLNDHVNPIVWTVRIELVCSALMPLIYLFNDRAGSLGRVMLLTGLAALAFAEVEPVFIQFTYMFYLGSLVPHTITAFRTLARSPASVALLVALAIVGWLVAGSSWPTGVAEANLIRAFVSFLVIGLTVASVGNTAWNKLLQHRILRFFGRVSYSFYLLHFLCVYIITQVAIKAAPSLGSAPITWMVILLGTSVGCATLLAWVVHSFVERPAIIFSKRFVARPIKRPS